MKKILIIDDEQGVRDVCVKALVEEGFIVRQASDALKGFNILVREDIDLVLLDIKMPEVDGKTMMEVIKEFNPNMKVIISSVYPVIEQKKRVPDASDYYDKSRGLAQLIDKVYENLTSESITQ